jgi:hypothetical protein
LIQDNSLFEKGSWGGVENSIQNSFLKAVILFPKTIGLPVALQIHVSLLICCQLLNRIFVLQEEGSIHNDSFVGLLKYT